MIEFKALAERSANVNGMRMRYRVGGSGPPLVLLHDSPQTALSWRKLVPLLPENRTVVAPDLRGYGGSDKPGLGNDLETM